MNSTHGREPRADLAISINQRNPHHNPKAAARGKKIGTDFRHAVEFSRSGRARPPAFRPSVEATSLCTPHNVPVPQGLPATLRASRSVPGEDYTTLEAPARGVPADASETLGDARGAGRGGVRPRPAGGTGR